MARTLNGTVIPESGGLPTQQQLISALLDPQRYPHQAKAVHLIETHISWVLLAGRYAYKIKKAVDLEFINATGLETRAHFCREELRLNRRLAPQLYLDVVTIGGTSTQPVWGCQPAIEYAVKMRRFSPAKTLDHLVSRGKIEVAHMEVLAKNVAIFHSSLLRTTIKSDVDFAANIHAALTQNFTQLAGLLTETANMENLRKLQTSCEQSYAAFQQLLQERQLQGYVRECHGDLHLGNIVLIGNEATPFDGIDFNPALRWIDVMDEVAFLFMDLLHHRQPQLAYRFLNTYLEHTGDYAGLELLSFYAAYRATVRAKVGAIRAHQSGKMILATCRDYLSLANSLLEPRQPALIITRGLPGSGKSRFSRLASERLGAIRLRSDVERKRLFGLAALENSSPEQNIYSTEATQRTYSHLIATAQSLLRAGHTVIVDAAFLKQSEREMFAESAKRAGVPFAIAAMHADDDTLRTRILQRQERADDASEADIAVLEKLQSVQEVLSPQELRYTATFRNTEDAPSWNAFQDLLTRMSAQ